MYLPRPASRNIKYALAADAFVLVARALVFSAALALTVSCSSNEPSEARQMACKIAYTEELEKAEEKHMKDSIAFKQRSEREDVPAGLSIRVQESFNNNLEYIKARASQKLENCLSTGYYERPVN